MPQINPLQMRRMDGFSDDGLSYSVASDFNKIAGQALADYEARVKNPRGLHESEEEYNRRRNEAPNLLNAEIGALVSLFGGEPPQQPRYSGPKTFEIGNQIVQQDPITGQYVPVFTGTPTPRPEPKFPIPTELNTALQPAGVKMLTVPQIGALLPSLPDRIRTNPPATMYQGWLQSSNRPPAVAAPATNTAPIVVKTGSGKQFTITPR
jgi:hypothetical protein